MFRLMTKQAVQKKEAIMTSPNSWPQASTATDQAKRAPSTEARQLGYQLAFADWVDAGWRAGRAAVYLVNEHGEPRFTREMSRLARSAREFPDVSDCEY